MQVTITETKTFELSDAEVDRVLDRKLVEFMGGRWTAKGQLWEEHCTSHRYDAAIEDRTGATEAATSDYDW